MNALVATSTPTMSFNEVARLAVAIAKSGLFGFKTPEQAMAIMMIAQAEGRHPALAARDYHVIQGQPAKKPEAMMRDFQEAGGTVEWHELTDEKASATFSHPRAPKPVRIEWDMKRAVQAKLANKENWKNYPRQMLRSRVVSEGVRTVWPNATSGMYVTDEVADFAGPTLDHEPTPADTPPPSPDTPVIRTDREEINAAIPLAEQPKQPGHRSNDELLTAMETAMRECGSLDAVNKLLANRHVQQMQRDFTGTDKERFDRIRAAGLAAHGPVTHPEAEESGEPLPDWVTEPAKETAQA